MWIWIIILVAFTAALGYYYYAILLPKQRQVDANQGMEQPPAGGGGYPDPKKNEGAPAGGGGGGNPDPMNNEGVPAAAAATRYESADRSRFIEVRGACAADTRNCTHWTRASTDPPEGVYREHAALAELFAKLGIDNPTYH